MQFHKPYFETFSEGPQHSDALLMEGLLIGLIISSNIVLVWQ